MDGSQRALVVLGGIVAALLVVLGVVLVTGGDGDRLTQPGASTDPSSPATTQVVTTATTSPTPPSITAGEPGPDPEPAAPEPEPEAEPGGEVTVVTIEDDPLGDDEDPGEPVGFATELWRGAAVLDAVTSLRSATTPDIVVGVADGEMWSSRVLTLVSRTPPGPFGCRDQPMNAMANPIPLVNLAFATGFHACAGGMGDMTYADVFIADVSADTVAVEIVVWLVTGTPSYLEP